MLKPCVCNKIVVLCFLIIIQFEMILGSSVGDLKRLNNGATPKLLVRYEKGTSMFKVGEDLQLFRPPTSNELLGEGVAIRVCSDKELLLTIPTTTINPVQIADFLINIWGLKSSNIFFLNSKDCISSVKNGLYPVEIWNFQKVSDLPPNNERYNYEQIKYVSLGFDPVQCPKSNGKNAAKLLIKKMLNDKNSYGAIVSYYLSNPSLQLTKKVKAIQKLLKKYNISSSRYSVTKQSWHDGDSPCANKEPTEPMIIFITLTKQEKSLFGMVAEEKEIIATNQHRWHGQVD